MSQNPSSKEKLLMLEIPKRNQSRSKFKREINPASSSKEKPPFQRETTVPKRNQHLYIEFWSGYFGIFWDIWDISILLFETFKKK